EKHIQRGNPRQSRGLNSSLKTQTCRTRGLGQRGDAAVKLELPAIEANLLHAGGQGALGDGLADRLRGVPVAAVFDLAQTLVLRRGRGQRLADLVVDDLRVHVLVRAEHRQTRALGAAADTVADAPAAADALS